MVFNPPPPHPKFRGGCDPPAPPPCLALLIVSLYVTIIFHTKFYQSMHHNASNMS